MTEAGKPSRERKTDDSVAQSCPPTGPSQSTQKYRLPEHQSQETDANRFTLVSVNILRHRNSGLQPALGGDHPCHSRAGGNPGSFDCLLDPCLRRGDRVGVARHYSEWTDRSSAISIFHVCHLIFRLYARTNEGTIPPSSDETRPLGEAEEPSRAWPAEKEDEWRHAIKNLSRCE